MNFSLSKVGSDEGSEERTHSPLFVAVTTIVSFYLIDTFDWVLFNQFASDAIGYERLISLIAFRYVPQLLLVLSIALALFGINRTPAVLGLNRSLAGAVTFAVLATLPMSLGMFLTLGPRLPDDLFYSLVRGALFPGMTEELLYRGFLFGFLFRYAYWGFIPAAAISSGFFGAAHLYQGGGIIDATQIFLITGIAAIWFAWLYVEWDFNIWIPMALHVSMNAWWEIFSVSDTALGGVAVDMMRVAVILFSIAFTLVRASRRGAGRKVKGSRWLWGGP